MSYQVVYGSTGARSDWFQNLKDAVAEAMALAFVGEKWEIEDEKQYVVVSGVGRDS